MIVYNYRALGQKLKKVLAFIGSILGTGHNTAAQIGDEIFNLESGNFNGVQGVQSIVDRALDQEVNRSKVRSPNVGENGFLQIFARSAPPPHDPVESRSAQYFQVGSE